MQRYFIDKHYDGENQFHLEGDAYHHISHVMRMKVNDEFFIVFSEGKSGVAKIVDITNEEIIANVVKWEDENKEMPVKVTIASGLPKGDKLELIIQKGTELGAFQFVPFIADRSIVKWEPKKEKKKLERWQRIALEAAEQAHRQYIPKVTAPLSFKKLLEYSQPFDHKLVAFEESAKLGETSNFVKQLNEFNAGETVLIVFGPEGGLTNDEVKQMEESGFCICGLGPRILRTETAPLYALSAISYQLELMR
ncbi:16S rRNA (uracil(1498)-N(3))-methyltransferase [Heyndrickxia oleronia]|jgi:16S rRNA (uracil1498-N3)-methyltransferase|uniref:16S rRNA (uracil(1498)-N(3))-methyltransferase n=1 Tax=Heyndrickxia oleronia TaxID=38875 RepID=UPI001C0E9E3A|nr:16S rRNA (uracil(1498)-N(3))-methyltransferase [Heyndrickxia oleronia]MBU5213469.1 16S rRNA (uracil(1498)-N(3))-methyltransferase [Heyndrickxia oleronia]MCI1591848.1 16S rRNA (uracil(1498)-N(3))-methyltransferase [Heyndrickxia oleronia]MCI1614736.1 16S rRNA (uracil(1498)-N(3))-methyltransferase [Heyndrickxia oleronia]MCI1745611.1 16S rRNA (uracil(1498)-N(3))-methyltransferase [Heyndrickxia oleronia]MCI1762622.1 16S rRNA (uracil(1498)-N(3))-methyltransferase [Heyndrickxia oleronia]